MLTNSRTFPSPALEHPAHPLEELRALVDAVVGQDAVALADHSELVLETLVQEARERNGLQLLMQLLSGVPGRVEHGDDRSGRCSSQVLRLVPALLEHGERARQGDALDAAALEHEVDGQLAIARVGRHPPCLSLHRLHPDPLDVSGDKRTTRRGDGQAKRARG
jgi:hypothetical protein